MLKTSAIARFDKSYFPHVILHSGRCHVKLYRKDKTSQVVPVLHGLHGDSEKRHAPSESLSDSSLFKKGTEHAVGLAGSLGFSLTALP